VTAQSVPLLPRRLDKHGRVVEAEEWTSAIERFSATSSKRPSGTPAALVHVKQLSAPPARIKVPRGAAPLLCHACGHSARVGPGRGITLER
jgi:hypothetical protein